MATSFWSSLLATLMLSMACYSSQVLSQISAISASPAYLPTISPVSSPPALSPDITPLFPTPRGVAPSPDEASLPTIPSSPSPPNPDNFLPPAADQPATSPSQALPVASAQRLNSVVYGGFLVYCLLQLAFTY